MKPEQGNGERVKKKRVFKFLIFFFLPHLPLIYKRWSTLHKIYYLQAEILSSAGAIHHPGRETL